MGIPRIPSPFDKNGDPVEPDFGLWKQFYDIVHKVLALEHPDAGEYKPLGILLLLEDKLKLEIHTLTEQEVIEITKAARDLELSGLDGDNDIMYAAMAMKRERGFSELKDEEAADDLVDEILE